MAEKILDSRGRPRVQTHNKLPSETVQSDAHLADITNIMKQFGQTGIAMLDETELEFRDVTEFTDLADALNQARIAEVQFLKLPSKVREIFDHDVAVWLDTSHDKEKRDALVAAGLITNPQESVKRRGRREGEEGAGDPAKADPVRTDQKGGSEEKRNIGSEGSEGQVEVT